MATNQTTNDPVMDLEVAPTSSPNQTPVDQSTDVEARLTIADESPNMNLTTSETAPEVGENDANGGASTAADGQVQDDQADMEATAPENTAEDVEQADSNQGVTTATEGGASSDTKVSSSGTANSTVYDSIFGGPLQAASTPTNNENRAQDATQDDDTSETDKSSEGDDEKEDRLSEPTVKLDKGKGKATDSVSPDITSSLSAPTKEDLDLPVTNVNEDGDLYLIIGPDPKTEFRVLSGLLKSNSKVFRVMLSENWLEGQKPESSNDKWRINLPEDDADAMLLILAAMHARTDLLRPLRDPDLVDKQTAKKFVMLLQLLDKYDCENIMYPWDLLWRRAIGMKIRSCGEAHGVTGADYVRLIAFDVNMGFASGVGHSLMVLVHTTSIDEESGDLLDKYGNSLEDVSTRGLPEPGIVEFIKELRNKAIRMVMSRVRRLFQNMLYSRKSCGCYVRNERGSCSYQHFQLFMRALDTKGLHWFTYSASDEEYKAWAGNYNGSVDTLIKKDLGEMKLAIHTGPVDCGAVSRLQDELRSECRQRWFCGPQTISISLWLPEGYWDILQHNRDCEPVCAGLEPSYSDAWPDESGSESESEDEGDNEEADA